MKHNEIETKLGLAIKDRTRCRYYEHALTYDVIWFLLVK